MRWLFLIVLGAGLGLAAAIADAAAPAAPTSALRGLLVVTHLGTTWAAAALFGGWLVARRPWPVLAGPLVLASGVVAYHGYVQVEVDPSRITVDSLGSVVGVWLLAAITVGPMLGLLGGITRSGSVTGMVARLIVPVGLVVEVLVRVPVHGGEYASDPIRAWTSTALIVAAVFGALVATIGPPRSSQ